MMRVRIPIKSPKEIDRMRESGKIASQILQQLLAEVKPGVTTKEIDQLAADLMAKNDCRSAFLGYRGFVGQICISVNEEVVHGIGGPRRIQLGDIVKIDVGIIKSGFIGDNASTVACGEIPLETKRLLAVTEQSLYEAISHARAGRKLADLCGSVAQYAEPFGFTIVRESRGKSPTLMPGMTLAIEPMINAGVPEVRILDDGWTVITADRKPSAHFEHTVLITHGDPEILTDRPRVALPEQIGIPAL